MKIVYCGLEGEGKSLYLSTLVTEILKTNVKYKKKGYGHRKLYSNMRFSEHIEHTYGDYIVYWEDIREILGLKGVDILWDEISTDLSAQKREPLPRRFNQWFRQGNKQGVYIYATAQEFHDIHLDFRRRVRYAYNIEKSFGSKRPGPNLPPTKRVYGLCWKRRITIRPYNELQPEYSRGKPFLITKKKTSFFNTNQTIETSKELPYEHIEYTCSKESCKLPAHLRVKHR
jgi:hypothetical protein